jgi:hypothetical protein
MILCPRNRILSDIQHPSATDICCGRGKGRWNSPGNQKFKELVREHLQQYENAPSKAEKSKIVEYVVEAVQNSGGRFVKRDVTNRKWYEIGASETRSKVAHAIRDHLATCKRESIRFPSNNKSREARNQAERSRDDNCKQTRKGSECKKFDKTELKETPSRPHLNPGNLPTSQVPQCEVPLHLLAASVDFGMVLEPGPSVRVQDSQLLSERALSHFQGAMLPMQGQVDWQAPEQIIKTGTGEGFGQLHHHEEPTSCMPPWPHQFSHPQAQNFLGLPSSSNLNQNIAFGNNQEQQQNSSFAERQGLPAAGNRALRNLTTQDSILLRQPPIPQLGPHHTGCQVPDINNEGRKLPAARSHYTSQVAISLPATPPQDLHDNPKSKNDDNSGQVRPMVSRQVPVGVIKQSWDFIEEEFTGTYSPGDIEPNAVFPPE